MFSEHLLRKLPDTMTMRKITDPAGFAKGVAWATEMLLEGCPVEEVRRFIFTMDFHCVNRIVHAARRAAAAKRREVRLLPVEGHAPVA